MKVADFTLYAQRGAAAALAGLALLSAPAAHAYVGPGAGLSAIGVLVALIGAIALAIVGFVWYPLKRLFRKAASGKAGTDTKSGSPSRH